ncbi:hypothetical protein ACLB2K_013656 [Fragaria x ananassa]
MVLLREESVVLQILHCGSLQSLESQIGTAIGDEEGRGGTFECSAMGAHHLTFKFGIHGGGINLIFPHHENEIAHQSCAGSILTGDFQDALRYINTTEDDVLLTIADMTTARKNKDCKKQSDQRRNAGEGYSNYGCGQ